MRLPGEAMRRMRSRWTLALRSQPTIRDRTRLARGCKIAWFVCAAGACGDAGFLTPVLPAEAEAEAQLLESIADSAERGGSPRFSVELRHLAQVVRLSRGLSTVSLSVDGVTTQFHAATEVFFTVLPTFPAESLATGVHIHLWERPSAKHVLTLFIPSPGIYAIISPLSAQVRAGATGQLLNRGGEEWQTTSGTITGVVLEVFSHCQIPQPSRDQPGFGCRQALFRYALDATVTASALNPISQAANRRLILSASSVEGVLLPAVAVLPSSSSRLQ